MVCNPTAIAAASTTGLGRKRDGCLGWISASRLLGARSDERTFRDIQQAGLDNLLQIYKTPTLSHPTPKWNRVAPPVRKRLGCIVDVPIISEMTGYRSFYSAEPFFGNDTTGFYGRPDRACSGELAETARPMHEL